MLQVNLDRIVCINLDRRTDRWADCEKEFYRLRWEDVVQRVVPEHNSDPNYSRCLTQAAILEKAWADRIDNILILEDDVQFVANPFTASPPAGYDMIYLGFTCHLLPNTSAAEVASPYWLRLLRVCHGAFAVVYARHVFEEVAAGMRQHGQRITTDMWLANTFQPRGKVYAPNPPIAYVRDSQSDISTEAYRQFGKALTLGQYNTAAARFGWKLIPVDK